MHLLHDKHTAMVALFESATTPEAVYQRIMEIGQEQSDNFPWKSEENRVSGCQSTLYLYYEVIDQKIFFKAHSDALISKGLAELLVRYYSGEHPESILKEPPLFLEELGISSALSPTRASGLYNIHLKMKQIALGLIVSSSVS